MIIIQNETFISTMHINGVIIIVIQVSLIDFPNNNKSHLTLWVSWLRYPLNQFNTRKVYKFNSFVCWPFHHFQYHFPFITLLVFIPRIDVNSQFHGITIWMKKIAKYKNAFNWLDSFAISYQHLFHWKSTLETIIELPSARTGNAILWEVSKVQFIVN